MAYSVSYVPVGSGLGVGFQPISSVSSVQNHPLGTIIQAFDGTYGMGEFIYLKGLAATAQGSWVTYAADDFATALLAANAIGPVAVAMAATIADTYGWYQISGKTVGKCAASYADNGLVYATATAGTIDDAVVAGDRVKNALGASAIDTPATGFAEFEIQRPWMDDATAA
jgi:hypothetical protein